MAEVLRLPRMSDTMEEGVIADLKIKVGDTLNSGDIIAEVETDKATMEWESFQEGKVLYVAVSSGDTVPINAIVAIIGAEGEDYQALLAAAPEEDNEPSVETEKIDDSENVVEFEFNEEKSTDTTQSDDRIKASPLAKKIAEDKGIDLANIKGTGDEGRITKRDVENVEKAVVVGSNTTKEEKEVPSETAKTISLPQIVGEERYHDEKVSQMRKTIAKRLGESKFTAPHFYLTIDVNMNNAMAARAQMNEYSPVKISFNDLVIKATALAIRKNPLVNTSWLGDVIRHNEHIHIGMAVATDFGLLVPVIRFADNKSLSHIAAEAKQFAAKARDKKIMPEDMQGNTFSISNLGAFGITEFTAVINPPDSCILAVGSIQPTLGFNDKKEVVENNIMKLTLSCDHRTVDGAVGAKFLNDLKLHLENPVTMLV